MHGFTRGPSARFAALVGVPALGLVLGLAVALVGFLASARAAPITPYISSDHGASFAVRCDFSHRSSDDPIVHPNMPGMAHSHDFFGNVSTASGSTGESLRAAGTTCSRPEDTAAYWMPTLSWNGQEVSSDRAVFYYRAGGKNRTLVRAFPPDLKMVTPHGERVQWRCGGINSGKGTGTPPARCDGGLLGVRVMFPDCFDGRLDSADHRSHVAYSRYRDGRVRCPASHPRSLPALTMNATFRIPAGEEGALTLSSGPASTVHADFFNAWDQVALAGLVKRCINGVGYGEKRPEECQAPDA